MKIEDVFSNPQKLAVLNSKTRFSANLSTLIKCRIGGVKNQPMPYRLKREGGQYLGVVEEKSNFVRYESEAIVGKGCNWNCIYAPTSEYDYYNEFDYNLSYFCMVTQCYLSMLYQGEEDFEKLITATPEEREDFLGTLGFMLCGESIRDEILEIMGIGSLKDADDIAALSLFLSAAYVHYYINSIPFPEEWKEMLCKNYKQMFLLHLEMEEGVELPTDKEGMEKLEEEYEDLDDGYIISYLDYFLDYIEMYFYNESKSVYPALMPMIMAALFTFQASEEGEGAYLYMYSSKELKEYRDLKEKYPDSPYVEKIDKMMPFLLDPVGIKETAFGGCFIPWRAEDGTNACVEYGFFDEEYAYCYMCFADEDEIQVPSSFSMAMSHFIHLLGEFKKEVETYGENEMVRSA